jgi:DNA-binding response OmpR family regulator
VGLANVPPASANYSDERLRVDVAGIEVEVDGRPVHLTPLEFRLLTALVGKPGQLVEREALLRAAWPGHSVPPDRVKPHVSGLRRKLGEVGARIETVRGHGYRYRPG